MAKAKQNMTTDDVRSAQEQLRDWWGRGVDLRQQIDDWAVHIFWEPQRRSRPLCGEGTQRPTEGVGGRLKSWPEVVTAYAVQVCFSILSQELWEGPQFTRNVGRYLAGTRDAEIAGCSMLIDFLNGWTHV